jgi:hypothetical protein
MYFLFKSVTWINLSYLRQIFFVSCVGTCNSNPEILVYFAWNKLTQTLVLRILKNLGNTIV